MFLLLPRRIRVQEQSQASLAGSPKSLTVLLLDDLADCAQVGGECSPHRVACSTLCSAMRSIRLHTRGL